MSFVIDNPGVRQVTDAELVNNALSGRPQSFDPIVLTYFGRVYAIAYAHLRDREAAEELAQDVFLQVYLHLDKLSARENLSHWICRITRNLALNWIRNSRRKSRLVSMIPMSALQNEIPDPLPAPDQAAIEAENRRRLHEALMSIEAEVREAVLLHFLEGMTKAEIAALHGVHPSTLGRQIDHALHQLGEKIGADELKSARKAWKPGKAAALACSIVTAASALPAAQKTLLLQAANGFEQLSALAPAPQKPGFLSAPSPGKLAFIPKPLVAGAAVVLSLGLIITGANALRRKDKPLSNPKPQSVSIAKLRDSPTISQRPLRKSQTDARSQVNPERTPAPLKSGVVELPETDVLPDRFTSGNEEWAETSTGTLLVKVRDEQGNPVAKAIVRTGAFHLEEDTREWSWVSENSPPETDEAGAVLLTYSKPAAAAIREFVISVFHSDFKSQDAVTIPFRSSAEVVLHKDTRPKGELDIRVVDEEETPIPGAFVHTLKIEKKVITDDTGTARIDYIKTAAGENQVEKVTVFVSHPNYVAQFQRLEVPPTEHKVELKQSGGIIVSAYMDDSPKLVTDFEPMIAGGISGQPDWVELDPTHKACRSIEAGNYALYVKKVSGDRKWFSDVVDVKIDEKTTLGMSLQLRPAIKLNGRLSDDVPRPVLNGAVTVETQSPSPMQIGPRSNSFFLGLPRQFHTMVNTDGTFQFSGVPPGQGFIYGTCNGYCSLNGGMDPQQGSTMIPQQFDLTKDTDIVLEMGPTSVFKATVLKPDGNPLSGAGLAFSVGVRIGNYGTGIRRGFKGVTDTWGNVTIPDIPGFLRSSFSFTSPDGTLHLPVEMQCKTITGFTDRNSHYSRPSCGMIDLKPGKTTNLQITLSGTLMNTL